MTEELITFILDGENTTAMPDETLWQVAERAVSYTHLTLPTILRV